jgi:trehalose/maltose transport system substrate-binding protein
LRHTSQFSRAVIVFGLFLFNWPFVACRQAPPEPTTLTFIDPEWSHDISERKELMEISLQEFTKETGIQIRHLPAPEAVADQLALIRQLLDNGTADVVGIDVIWPGILSDKLVDLRPLLSVELAAEDPELVSNFTVRNRLVAVPFHTNVGVLFYRRDLLRAYGFQKPPKTWEELEKMAARIQAGERAKGNRDFWGYFWPAAAGEGLTCDALEWQFTEGGGHIIEPDGTITVNNPRAVRSWERAASWIGRISPPATLSYQEWDSINAFRYQQRGAFLRGWTSDYFLSNPVNTAVFDREGVTAMPGGSFSRAGAMGGFGLAIARSTKRQAESLQFVKFLLRKEAQLDEIRRNSHRPGQVEMVDLPAILKAYSTVPQSPGKRLSGVVARPSTITAEKYDKVSRAYFETVHSVLSGKTKANAAALNLERSLREITGFHAGPP